MFKEKIQNLRRLYYFGKEFSRLEKRERSIDETELNFMSYKAVGILGGECDSQA